MIASRAGSIARESHHTCMTCEIYIALQMGVVKGPALRSTDCDGVTSPMPLALLYSEHNRKAVMKLTGWRWSLHRCADHKADSFCGGPTWAGAEAFVFGRRERSCGRVQPPLGGAPEIGRRSG